MPEHTIAGNVATGASKYIGAHPPGFSREIAAQAAEDIFGISGELRPLWGERDQNFAIHDADGPAYVLKISNALEEPGELDLQLQALKWLARTSPELAVPKLRLTLEGKDSGRLSDTCGREHAVHMISHLPGIQLAEVDLDAETFRGAGRQAGTVALALRGFHHGKAGHALFWDIRHIEAFAGYTSKIRDRTAARAVSEIASGFGRDITPALERLRAQVIHHDTNPANVLVDPENTGCVMGLVDFGDMIHGPVVQDAAVAALELATGGTAVVEDAARVIAGYDAALPLEADEIDLIYDLMVARAGLGLLIGATRLAYGVTSAEDLDYDEMYGPALDTLLTAGRDRTRAALRTACRFPVYTPAPSVPKGTNRQRTERLIKRRQEVLGTWLPLSYDEPLHTEKGDGPWLFDADGRPHLDCYNNVAHVGHSHPHVVRTMARQAAVLNTNTRYAFESVVAYAERLRELVPGKLGAFLFVNSGSEAVDLALRIAKAVSGQDGMLAMDGAYHGITVESHAVSPATQWDAPKRGRHSHVSETRPDIGLLVNPDTFRGPFGPDVADVALRYAADADRAIGDLARAGHPVGAFIVDTAFSSSGILDVPDGYLPAVVQKVHAAGGLVIADEVQFGFGRSGRHFWGFENYRITPDLVTLGKPIGNGIALGCVATTPEILDRFTSEHAFFSTFGGNPVACAAAGAVLDVLERDALQKNAEETGGFLLDGLREIGRKDDCVGDVRGRGLFIGVDIVRDKSGKAADGERCTAIKNNLRTQGILVSSEGFHGNILKIRPPMVFGRGEAEILLKGMERALQETTI